ncbi:MAG TPA: carboxymuconolactone decarboxylase family protein [Novosphingobium sp.]|nr:carboxymuconolactone decarboxylase family protein [Novosphingobium sp.]
MRLAAPRIAPLDLGALDAEAAEVLAPFKERGPVLNIFATMARAPQALKAFLGWGGYVLSKRNSLSERDRELAILRTGFACKAGYEWTQHVPIGLRGGLTAEEIERIKAGPGDPAWSPRDRAILTACDELVATHFVTDATWTALEELGDRGRMDLVFTVGQYTQVSMMLNSFGVQLDPGQSLDPALDAR